MTRKQRRLTMIGAAGVVMAMALGLVLVAMQDTIVFFRAPSEIAEQNIEPGTRFRLGGLVEDGSIRREDGQIVFFKVSDGAGTVEVRYQGLLPDLFREGQGVVTEGALDMAGLFVADTVLARHDENYMPREVADALKKQGVWQHGGDAGTPTPGTPTPGMPTQ